ncbi:MAG: hypothetical protein ABIP44_02550 [Pseudoxanthomonas sp.]
MKLFDDLSVLWQRRYWRAAIVACGIAMLGILLLGGFERAARAGDGDLPESPAGQRVETGAFALTPLCAWTSDLYPGQPHGLRGQRQFLVLRMRVESLTDDWLAMSAYLAKDVVWLADGSGEPREPKYTQRTDDHTSPVLQPALPLNVDLIWELPAGIVAPRLPTWGVYRRRHVERGYLAGDEFWVQDGRGYRVPMALTGPCGGVAA